MSTAAAIEVILTCNRSIARMQVISSLLLLSDDIRPTPRSNSRRKDTAETTPPTDAPPNASAYKDCTDRIKSLSTLVAELVESLAVFPNRWTELCASVETMDQLTEQVAESCVRLGYLIAVNQPNCSPAIPGCIDTYSVLRANAELSLCADRLKQTSVDRLAPPMLVQICAGVGSSLSNLADCFKRASTVQSSRTGREQFRECVGSFVAAGVCFMSSAKTFKCKPTETHRQRCSTFCDALLTCTNAAVTFATEPQFVGRPAKLTPPARDAMKCIMGKL